MNLSNLSIQEASKIVKQQRTIDELGRLTLSLEQRKFLGWKENDHIICQLGEDEKSLILRKKY